MKNRLLKRLQEEGLLSFGKRYVIALSGGRDSVALLFLLWELKLRLDLDLCAVHINHGLRREADRDERFCVSLCSRLGIPLIVYREQVAVYSKNNKLGLEAAGRQIRYHRLAEAAVWLGACGVLTAHHQQDQAETLLLHLTRGSGLPGLSGIPRQRELVPGVSLIRPLLSSRPEELEEFLREEGESWREDQSNRDERFERNYVRHSLLKTLSEHFPRLVAHMGEAAFHLQECHQYMEEQAGLWLADHAGENALPLEPLLKAPSGLLYYIWRELLKEEGLEDISRVHWEALKRLPYLSSGSLLQLPGGLRIRREQTQLSLLRRETGPVSEERPLAMSLEIFPFRTELKIPSSLYTKWMDYAIISGDLCIRHRKPGDYFYLDEDRKKSLGRFMIDQKIPLSLRDKLWVLAEGSHVLWIIGYRLSYRARIRENTKTVAAITIIQEGATDGEAHT